MNACRHCQVCTHTGGNGRGAQKSLVKSLSFVWSTHSVFPQRRTHRYHTSSGSSTLSLSSQQNQLPRVSNQSLPSSSSRATKPLLHDPSRPHDQKPGNAVCSIPGKKPPSLPLFSPILLPTQGDASGAAVIELTPQPCDCWHVPIPTHSRRKLNDPLAQQQLPA